MDVLEIIGRKRDGHEHTAAEIELLIGGYVAGRIPDYQMAAWLMAVTIRGMSDPETAALTRAMVASGDVVDLSRVPGVKVDKHSTGGVGDKLTLIAGPLAAACGVRVPKLSGRGLAHTGGTLDKLESVPGLRVELEPEEFVAQVNRIGIAVAAQSPRLVPADKLLYALRDVTATVPSVPLIASSVMSKKLAAGADAIVLDVKVGRGAFMHDLESAIELARQMVAIGEAEGRATRALLTTMDAPLGNMVGNALEIKEVISVLSGRGPRKLEEAALTIAREMCELAKVSIDPEPVLRSGAGLRRLEEMLAAQGGRLQEGLPEARFRVPVVTPAAGYVTGIDALEVGLVSMELGAGRRRKEDVIDPAAGVEITAPLGARVEAGRPLAFLHAASRELAEAQGERLRAAWTLAPEPARLGAELLARVTKDGVTRY